MLILSYGRSIPTCGMDASRCGKVVKYHALTTREAVYEARIQNKPGQEGIMETKCAHKVELKSTRTHGPAAWCTVCKQFVQTVFEEGLPVFKTAAEIRAARRA